MCLAVPGQIVDVRDERGIKMATIDFDGIKKDICLAYLPDIVVGDYAIVHVGFAISKIDEASAMETLKMFRDLGILEEELEPTGGVSDDESSIKYPIPEAAEVTP